MTKVFVATPGLLTTYDGHLGLILKDKSSETYNMKMFGLPLTPRDKILQK